MRNLMGLLVGSAMGLGAVSAHAQAISCNTEYTVQTGDFLSGIAKRAYGSLNSFKSIYNANRELIGPNPGIIRVGQKLYIPCLDGKAGATEVKASAPKRADKSADNGPISVITSSGWSPFLDESDAHGGLLTEIVELSLANAGQEADYEIDFINDIGAHLNPLLTKGAFDASIGHLKPDCDNAAKLGKESKFLCENFDFSDPMYEEVFGYYSLSGSAEFKDHQELVGKTICRAEDYTLLPLEAAGIAEPAVSLVRAPDAASCIDYIMNGQADVALVAVDVADSRIKGLNAANRVQLNESLSYIDFFHVVVAKSNPQGGAILSTINAGLKNIKESGLWFQTVRRHMSEFRRSGR